MKLQEEKQRIREASKLYRQSLNEKDYAAFSLEIIARLKAVPALSRATCMHTFWPMTRRREVDLRPFITELLVANRCVLLPVLQGDTLCNRQLFDVQSLVPNRWGVYEPPEGDCVPPSLPDVVLVPALALGRNGHRIGYGKGHYDRFLSETRALKIGVVYAACLYNQITAEPHDVRLDMVITECEQLVIA